MTPTRLDVLRKCAEPNGLRPIASDWKAIYWLAEKRFIEQDFAAPILMDWPLYRATPAGRKALEDEKP